ncbi:MAG: hypothetical protein MPEBLZ_02394 [Candidatus Methanoperedens nitroreducens]|uniref:Uncharacterized protein n=1 Tax=Candidatus Methanoperedens nitratireducens TaxID=1392998 RepID=A0A0P7ZH66_9EURY|nr:hypothetical protein [Candidatus Methanoperedens sp. BLZ2]KPQ43041.1 MAG: hypothetical protein MPEBLZ_02394 [Candidatus Methanoperedens sp. BLZ1]MBZ0174315.1 hypothetical protein [Candidatus Methanoperedens nitroreducens]MCX9079849.1 hypothetical protein [Candidatus Methanoperedens sp.]CAG0974577.1 hypothetical protein METP2_01597 [Methanosarcinales archaeon]MCX9087166.1 hypothetical protein [Candidatus Methanoperedens sp.]
METIIEYDEFYKMKKDIKKGKIGKEKQDSQMEFEEFILSGCKCTG